ncbi:hypothetical protein DFQ26_001776 [Actinomortierella ambigua]|nr:hypothetical protein DFQ26_001776 [Actinomortierella ambigua]
MSASAQDLSTAQAAMSAAVLKALADLQITLSPDQQLELEGKIASTSAATRASENSASTLAKVLKPPHPKPHNGQIDATEARNFIVSNEEYNSIVLLSRNLWTPFAVLRLEGDARAWWRSLLKDPATMPWDEFKEVFITAHSPPDTITRARTALHHLQQSRRTMAAYTHEFQTHLRLAANIDDSTTILYFVSGLDEKIRL